MHTRGKGKAGEDQAAQVLLDKGYEIVSRNYQMKHGEIDLIARSPRGVTVFVEVKVAYGTRYGHPLFWVTRAKQRRLMAMARQYCRMHAVTGAIRFDVVAITRGRVQHVSNAFLG